jgi:hypothetical protein
MRWRETRPLLTTPRDSHAAQSAEENREQQASPLYTAYREQSEHTRSPVVPCSGGRHTISTERIMQAVEMQKCITQQLEDLHARQKQRATQLRKTGLILTGSMFFSSVLLSIALTILYIFQPDILLQLLTPAGTLLASLVAVEGSIQMELSNSWLLAGATLAIVLMMVLWLRLMRYPPEV